MAKLAYFSNAIRDYQGDAFLARLPGAILKIRIDPMPADGETTPTGTLLATHTLATPAGTSVNGLLTITLPANVVIVATGTAAVAELLESDGTTKIASFNVGVTAGQFYLVLGSAAYQSGAFSAVTAFTITLPASATA